MSTLFPDSTFLVFDAIRLKITAAKDRVYKVLVLCKNGFDTGITCCIVSCGLNLLSKSHQ